MKLNPEVFKVDCETQCRMIESFLREKMTDLHRDGIVVAISGGLDSSAVVAFAREKAAAAARSQGNRSHNIAAASIAVVAADTHHPAVALLCVGLAGASLGFLPFNLPSASLLLGDSGALVFGFLLAALSILVHVAMWKWAVMKRLKERAKNAPPPAKKPAP